MRSGFLLLFFAFPFLFGQHPDEEVSIQVHDGRATLTVDAFRPMQAVASKFGGTAEDPFYQNPLDMMEAAAISSRVRAGVLIPRKHKIQVDYSIKGDGSPADLKDLLNKVTAAENIATPFAYQVRFDVNGFFLVPTRTRDSQGNIISITPLLDRKVTIPAGRRRINESAALMAKDLSVQTGLNVSCCQSVVAGIPWGMEVTEFGASNEPARSVLNRLGLYAWHARCDMQFCFIERM